MTSGAAVVTSVDFLRLDRPAWASSYSWRDLSILLGCHAHEQVWRPFRPGLLPRHGDHYDAPWRGRPFYSQGRDWLLISLHLMFIRSIFWMDPSSKMGCFYGQFYYRYWYISSSICTSSSLYVIKFPIVPQKEVISWIYIMSTLQYTSIQNLIGNFCVLIGKC